MSERTQRKRTTLASKTPEEKHLESAAEEEECVANELRRNDSIDRINFLSAHMHQQNRTLINFRAHTERLEKALLTTTGDQTRPFARMNRSFRASYHDEEKW